MPQYQVQHPCQSRCVAHVILRHDLPMLLLHTVSTWTAPGVGAAHRTHVSTASGCSMAVCAGAGHHAVGVLCRAGTRCSMQRCLAMGLCHGRGARGCPGAWRRRGTRGSTTRPASSPCSWRCRTTCSRCAPASRPAVRLSGQKTCTGSPVVVFHVGTCIQKAFAEIKSKADHSRSAWVVGGVLLLQRVPLLQHQMAMAAGGHLSAPPSPQRVPPRGSVGRGSRRSSASSVGRHQRCDVMAADVINGMLCNTRRLN